MEMSNVISIKICSIFFRNCLFSIIYVFFHSFVLFCIQVFIAGRLFMLNITNETRRLVYIVHCCVLQKGLEVQIRVIIKRNSAGNRPEP